MKEKITIYTESKFLPEKQYTFHVIFHEILGIDYELFDTSVSQVYKIVFPMGNFIEIKDDFFCNIPESISYCDRRFLPQRLIQLKTDVEGETMPFLYGNNVFTKHQNSLYCGGDLFGTAFFMLSRWEEYVAESYDRWGRFPEEDSCAVKFGLIKMPIVHVYAEFIRRIAAEYGLEIPVLHSYKKTLTHDVDYLLKWFKTSDFVKSCLGDLFRRFSFKSLKNTIELHKRNQDPYDVYDMLMSLSEQAGEKSTFYFLNTKMNAWCLSTDRGKQIVSNILARKHDVGIHSNYFLEKDTDKIATDIQFYETTLGQKLTRNRQHYLKIRMPQTMRILEQNNILQDSSLYFTHHIGFRTGMCIEHSLFDCEKRCQMKIKELPLTLMDVSLQDARNYDEAIAWVDSLIETVKKYHGNFVCLWHNSSFNAKEWNYIDGVYEHIVKTK